MSQRRQVMLLLLVPLIGFFFIGFAIGQVEMIAWTLAAVAWVVGFRTWARTNQ